VEGGFSKWVCPAERWFCWARPRRCRTVRSSAKLKDGDVVLIDGGCSVAGYQSDVDAHGDFGKAPEKVARVTKSSASAGCRSRCGAGWTAIGHKWDDGARKVVTDAATDQTTNTSRTARSCIGLDGHEHPYLVRGSKTVA